MMARCFITREFFSQRGSSSSIAACHQHAMRTKQECNEKTVGCNGAGAHREVESYHHSNTPKVKKEATARGTRGENSETHRTTVRGFLLLQRWCTTSTDISFTHATGTTVNTCSCPIWANLNIGRIISFSCLQTDGSECTSTDGTMCNQSLAAAKEAQCSVSPI